MANINNQGNWDALRQPNESRYLDNTPAETGGPILTEISATTVDIITPRGSSITTPVMTTDASRDITGFQANDCQINFTGQTGTGANAFASLAPADYQWSRGEFIARDSILTVTADSNFQWPGWQNPGTDDRYTIDLTNSFVQNQNLQDRVAAFPDPATTPLNTVVLLTQTQGGSFAGYYERIVDGNGDPVWRLNNSLNRIWTLHFSGAALAGNQAAGLVFGDGVIPFVSMGQFEWVNVTMGNGVADSSGTRATNWRWQGAAGSGGIAAQWDGFFGCNMTAWDATVNQFTHTANATNYLDASGLHIFMIDNTYSQSIIDNGFQTQRRTADAAYNLVLGVSANPRFRSPNGTEVADAQIDFGERRVYLSPDPATPAATIVKNTQLASEDHNADGNNYRTPSENFGYLVELSTRTVGAAVETTPVPGSTTIPAALPALNHWSYTNASYVRNAANTLNRVLNTVVNPGTFNPERAGVFVAGSEQGIELALDEAINNRDAAAATNLQRNGITDLSDAYAPLKIDAYNNNRVSFPVRVVGTSLVFDGSVSFRANEDTEATISPVVRTTGTINGGDRFNRVEAIDIDFVDTATTTLNNLELSGNTNLTDAEIGTNVIFSGGITSNFPTGETGDLLPAVSVRGGTTINIEAATTVNWTNIDFLGVDGTNQITVNRVAPGATEETVTIRGVPAALRTNIVPGTNVATPINFVDEPIVNSIIIPAPTTGRYAVQQVIGGADPVDFTGTGSVPYPANIAANTPITISFDDDVFSAGDSVIVYAKYDSTIGGVVYEEEAQTFVYDPTTPGREFRYVPDNIAQVLVANAADPRVIATGYPDTVDFIPTLNGDIAMIAIENTNDNDALTVPTEQGQGLAILIANSDPYFDAWYASRTAVTPEPTPIAQFGQGNLTTWDASRITFTSGDTVGTEMVQHTILNWEQNVA